jgi:hypothetical protein
MSLADCAAAYSLTGTLVSETPTSLPTAAGSSSSSGSAPTTTPPLNTSGGSSTVVSYIPSNTAVGTLSTASVTTNATITLGTPTTSKTSQFTGAANANGAAGGLLALGIAGVVAVL